MKTVQYKYVVFDIQELRNLFEAIRSISGLKLDDGQVFLLAETYFITNYSNLDLDFYLKQNIREYENVYPEDNLEVCLIHKVIDDRVNQIFKEQFKGVEANNYFKFRLVLNVYLSYLLNVEVLKS